MGLCRRGGSPSLLPGPQIECSSISDYAVKIVKANKLDHGEPGRRMGLCGWDGRAQLPWALGRTEGAAKRQFSLSSPVGSENSTFSEPET